VPGRGKKNIPGQRGGKNRKRFEEHKNGGMPVPKKDVHVVNSQRKKTWFKQKKEKG